MAADLVPVPSVSQSNSATTCPYPSLPRTVIATALIMTDSTRSAASVHSSETWESLSVHMPIYARMGRTV